MSLGAIILCGGRSSRMGRDKALLPLGPETMLQRVVRLASVVVAPSGIVVVAAREQPLPELPAAVTITFDRRPDRGPLEGLHAGLSAAPRWVEAAYVTGRDTPLLAPQFMRRLHELLAEYEIAVPRDERGLHPLAAIYRPTVLPAVKALLESGELALRRLFESVATREVAAAELRGADPALGTLRNLNTPEDYAAVQRELGLSGARPAAGKDSGKLIYEE